MAFPSFTATYHHQPYAEIDETLPALSTKGKVILVTGGGKGVGKAIALSFAKSGAKAIVITGRTEATLSGTTAELKKLYEGLIVRSFVADVMDEKATEDIFSTVESEIGKVDVLVGNAAYLSDPSSVAASNLDDYWKGFEINVKGQLILARAFFKHAAENATYINIASGACHIPYIETFSGYSASKAAYVRIVEYLAHEHPQVRFFNLQPGRVESDMARKGSQTKDLDAGQCLPGFGTDIR
jgi:NAD(P)-dependent dehydrogenase (short-subunit alcohol dehydrogenase family)